MQKEIGIKFFKEKAHKEMFDRGEIYTRHIGYYRENSRELGNGRGDEREGVLQCKLDLNTNILPIMDESGIVHNLKLIDKPIISQEILSNMHVFSFTKLKEEWVNIHEDYFTMKIPDEVSKYFFKNYGKYYTLIDINRFIEKLKNVIFEDGCLAYVTHFPVEYLPECDFTSVERFVKLQEMMDSFENKSFEDGSGKFYNFLEEYMGRKSEKYSIENEMRIVFGVFQKTEHITKI